MAKSKFTAVNFIASARKPSGYSAGEIVEFIGWDASGDGGGAQWKATGNVIAASQSPADLGDARLSDASGNEFELVPASAIEFDTFAELEASSIGAIGMKLACRERANAEYIIKPLAYSALPGDATLASGLVAELQLGECANVLKFGADKTGATSSKPAIDNAGLRAKLIGSTTDNPPLEYRSGVVFFPFGKYLIAQGEQIGIPLGVSWIGESPTVNYNIPGLINEAFGATIWVENTTVFPVITINGKQLRGSAAAMCNITFSHGQSLRQAGPYNGTLFEPTGLFMYYMVGCTFFELGYATAFKPLNSNGVRVHGCNFIKIGDANNQQSMPPASGYTYGDAVDFTTCYDSFISDTFIESCGGVGVQISTNTKISGSFIDLCARGVISKGDRNQIVGSSIKWHQADGIQLISSDGIVISSNVIMGNNYKSATDAASIGYGIRFTDDTRYFTILGNNLVDDYENIPAHAGYKTVRQGSIHLGAGTGTAGTISSCAFSDEDAQWEQSIKDSNPIQDNLSRITAGFVTVTSSQIQSSGPANLVHSPFTTASGSTLGTLTRRIAYRDENGTVIGQIPLYDSIT